MLAGRVGPDARIANSKMVKPDFAAADWNRPTSGLPVIQEAIQKSRSSSRLAIASELRPDARNPLDAFH